MDSGMPKKTNKSPPFARYYLIAYNFLSACGWSYVFWTATLHLLGRTDLSRVASNYASSTATSNIQRILSAMPYTQSVVPFVVRFQSQLPLSLVPLFDRARTTFLAIGPQTALVQSFAVLEIAHSLLGLVRSPVATTATQVASRLILVWGICEQYESARLNPIYTSMVLSWSIAEVIRYSFYAANLLHKEPQWLLWLRYNTFFLLYPTGAGSEATLIFCTLPAHRVWKIWDYGRATLFFIWWPGLYVMYTYMMKQRRKIMGDGIQSRTNLKAVKNN